jgi:hypothetical protein
MEFRVNNKSNTSHGSIVEVCIDDEWHEATHSAQEANNSQSPRDISVMIADSTSESVMIKWSGQQSIPSDNKNINGYDLSCTTSSLSDHAWADP